MNTCLVSSTHTHSYTIPVFHPQQRLGKGEGRDRKTDTFQLTQSVAVLLQSACSCGFLFSHDLSDFLITSLFLKPSHFFFCFLFGIKGCLVTEGGLKLTVLPNIFSLSLLMLSFTSQVLASQACLHPEAGQFHLVTVSSVSLSLFISSHPSRVFTVVLTTSCLG